MGVCYWIRSASENEVRDAIEYVKRCGYSRVWVERHGCTVNVYGSVAPGEPAGPTE